MRYPLDEPSILEWKKEIPQNDQILKSFFKKLTKIDNA